jgi:MarR family transcriptional regulator, transcriptional regulator for hemolysin
MSNDIVSGMTDSSPLVPPIGLRLARAARVVSQAFDRSLAEAGGSVAVWQILVLVRAQQWGTQSQMAEAMGITGATLTHHLNALERQGLVRRWHEDDNRRSRQVALTASGEELFSRLREVAQRHDERLRAQLSADELQRLAELLDRVQEGAA